MPTIGSTPNYSLQLPYGNRQNWTDIVNGNFKTIDALIGTFVSVTNLQGAWANNTAYTVGQNAVDEDAGVIYTCAVAHTSSSAPTTFLEERTAHTTYWLAFAVAARSRGAWATGTAYSLNDFVVSGSKYAVCITANTSGATFAADLALGYWSVLVDLSAAGSLVLPTLGGVTDANKFVVTDTLGASYTIDNQAAAQALLGMSTFGIVLAGAGTVAAARTSLQLGTAALLDSGVAANNLVQLNATPALPAVNGSLLTNLPTSNATTTFLGANTVHVTANVFVNGPNTGSIGASGQIWLIIAHARFSNGGAANTSCTAQIHNGTSGIANGSVLMPGLTVGAGTNAEVTICAVVTLTGATTFTLQGTDDIGGSQTGMTANAVSGTATKATAITAVRLQ